MKLRNWQRKRLGELQDAVFAPSRYANEVTLLAYSFLSDDALADFDYLKCAVLQTWSVLGKLKTVIVANRNFPSLDAFATKHCEVEVQIEPSLVPGDIDSMSADCCGKLHSRFATPYCLVIQDDGFPLRDSLGDFLGKYDYVGAPYVRISWWRNIVASMLGYWMSNGGFSLRSKRICEAAAYWWRKKYAQSHPSPKTIDDLFYTQTLPLHHPGYRLRYKIAPNKIAIRFSYDAIVPQPVKKPPMGFHRALTFEILEEKL